MYGAACTGFVPGSFCHLFSPLPPHAPLGAVTADCTLWKLMRRIFVSLNTEGAMASIINVPYYKNDKRRGSMKRVSQWCAKFFSKIRTQYLLTESRIWLKWRRRGKKGCSLNEANGILISFGVFRVFFPIHSDHSWLYGESPFLRNLFVCVHF